VDLGPLVAALGGEAFRRSPASGIAASFVESGDQNKSLSYAASAVPSALRGNSCLVAASRSQRLLVLVQAIHLPLGDTPRVDSFLGIDGNGVPSTSTRPKSL
jgi:hypothetical protein